MPAKKKQCPRCDGQRDARATLCKKCQFVVAHPRKGSGADKRISRTGYVLLMRDCREVYEHRHVMERHLGRELFRDEHVHHRNHDRADNRLDNLVVMSASDHQKEHNAHRDRDALGRFVN